MIKCPICGSTKCRNLFLDLILCTGCGHISKGVSVSRINYKNYISSAQRKVTPEHVKRANFVATFRANFLKAFKESGNVLEIGCGHDYFLKKVKSMGFNPEGTELSEALIKSLKDYKIYFGNPSEIKDLKKYDAIAMFHVLEHINKPIKEIKALVKQLNDDGVLIIEIPSMIFFDLELNPKDFYESIHTQYFNQVSLLLLLKKCGLKIIHQINFWDGTMAATLICTVKQTADIEKFKQKSLELLAGEKI